MALPQCECCAVLYMRGPGQECGPAAMWDLQNWTCSQCSHPFLLPASDLCGKVTYNMAQRLRSAGAHVDHATERAPHGVDRVPRGRDERIIIIIIGRAARRRPVPAIIIIVDAQRSYLTAFGVVELYGLALAHVVPDVLAVQFSTYAEVEAARKRVDRPQGFVGQRLVHGAARDHITGGVRGLAVEVDGAADDHCFFVCGFSLPTSAAVLSHSFVWLPLPRAAALRLSLQGAAV